MSDSLEREVKLGAWPGFELPDLTDIAEGVTSVPGSRKELDAVYYDTVDLRLIRSGITVRHRSSGTDDGEWTVKFPDEGDHPEGTLARREINVDGAGRAMPASIEGLVRGYARSAPLVPVARLQTLRQSLELRDRDGRRLGEVDDDEVSVLSHERIAARFREVEAEIAPDAPADLLGGLVGRLREAGAGAPDPTPKLVRALGPRALAAPELVTSTLDENPTAADVIQAGITAAVLRVIEHDHVIRLDDDIEGVHQARVGTRRLRSDLRTFRPLLDESWSEPLRDEIKWLADELGAVRDCDVLMARLQRQIAELPKEDQAEAMRFVAKLGRDREHVLAELLAALDTPRYAALLDRLVDAAREPRIRRAGARGAHEVVPALVTRPWKKLRKAVDALPAMPSDEALHGVRIRAKRARYAADVAVPVVGERAQAFAKALGRLQDVLGEHHDAIVAETWLRDAAVGATRSQSLTAGQLIAVQRGEAVALRDAWPAAWLSASKKGLRKWLS